MKQYQYILTNNKTSATLELEVNPGGFKELGTLYVRHEVYHSILRSKTLSLRFYNMTLAGGGNGGYAFIKAAYEADGINADISVQIGLLNTDTYAYDVIYNGVAELNPDKFEHEVDLYYQFPLVDSSALQKFISRDENEIDLLASQTLDGTSIAPLGGGTFYLTPVDVVTMVTAYCAIAEERTWSDMTAQEIYLENPTFTIQEYDGVNILADGGGTTPEPMVYTNPSTADVTMTVHYKSTYAFTGTIDNAVGDVVNVTYRYETYNKLGAFQTGTSFKTLAQAVIETNQTIDISGTIDEVFSQTIPANGGYMEITIYVQISGIDMTFSAYVLLTESLNIRFAKTTIGLAKTTANGVFPEAAFQRGIYINTGLNNFTSTPLGSGGEFERDAIMSGRHIRQCPSPKLSVTIRDLFKSFDGIGNLMLGYDIVNNHFYIDEKSKAYDSSFTLFNLGNVNNLKIKPLSRAYYCKITGGYENDGNYELGGGAHEFNVKREYSTIVKPKEELNIQIPYRFDSVGIEEVRNKQYLTKGNEDVRGDNDIFIVRTVDQYPVLNTVPKYLGIEIFYSHYNTMLSPRQNAIKWGNVLSACHYKSSADFIAQKTSKLFELELDNEDENSDIILTELATPLFIPELHTFERYVTPAMITALNTNPHGVVKYKYNGVDYESFIDRLQINDYKKLATFEVIAKDNSVVNRIFEDGTTHLFEDGTQKISE